MAAMKKTNAKVYVDDFNDFLVEIRVLEPFQMFEITCTSICALKITCLPFTGKFL